MALFVNREILDESSHQCVASASLNPLIHRCKGRVAALFRAFEFDGLIVLSDWKTGFRNEVFRPRLDEVSICRSFFTPPNPSASVLEIGCGSGIYSLFAARSTSGSVLGIDVNPRAIQLAKLNAGLNRIENVNFSIGCINDDRGEHFDFIIAALPYRPTPPFFKGKLYADGGVRGISLLQQAIQRFADRGTSHRVLRACLMSLASQDSTLVGSQLPGWIGNKCVTTIHCDLSSSVRFRNWWHENIGKPDDYTMQWLDEIEREGYSGFVRLWLEVAAC